MAWTIFAVVLILALSWQIHRRRFRATRGTSRDYRDVGPDEMRLSVEGRHGVGRPPTGPLPRPLSGRVQLGLIVDGEGHRSR